MNKKLRLPAGVKRLRPFGTPFASYFIACAPDKLGRLLHRIAKGEPFDSLRAGFASRH